MCLDDMSILIDYSVQGVGVGKTIMQAAAAAIPQGMVHNGPANHPHLARQVEPTTARQPTAAPGPAWIG